ncbi:hypothetical protein F4819DRAFT_133393 [Hypoxylon fuscum]|nr:hypothetical protein F4819DRAFT_133393 [Hypoxylon fuscum]
MVCSPPRHYLSFTSSPSFCFVLSCPKNTCNRPLRETQGSVDAFAWLLTVIAALLLGLRFWCRSRGNRRLWWDDHLLLVSLLLLIGDAAAFSALLNQVLDPFDYMTPSRPRVILCLSIFNIFNALAQAFGKTAIVLTFLRLTSGWWKAILCVALIVFDSILFIHVWITWVRDCKEPEFQGYRFPGQCVDSNPVWVIGVMVPVLSILLDLFLTLLPWKIVKNLRLELVDKLGLAMMMSTGVIATVACLERLYLWIALYRVPAAEHLTYHTKLLLWNFIEPVLSVIAACIPMLRALRKDVIRWNDRTGFSKRFFRKRSRSTSSPPNTENFEMVIIEGRNSAEATPPGPQPPPSSHPRSSTMGHAGGTRV